MAKCAADTLPEPLPHDALRCLTHLRPTCPDCHDAQLTQNNTLRGRLAAAEAVCEAIDGRHPIALGDRVGALLSAWRAMKGTP